MSSTGKSFRSQFKFYKARDRFLDLREVLNLSDTSDFEVNPVTNYKVISSPDVRWRKSLGMRNASDWRAYKIENKPGLIIIKNPFEFYGQRYWIIRCLESYSKKPNKLNIDAQESINGNDNWWEFCQRHKGTRTGALALQKLRWITFGYHHNWDTKKYSETSKCEFPADLKSLCRIIAEALDFSNFNAEAAIINIYHFGSTLSGHSDHSEANLSAPLFSFSFGQSAIFLIGGRTLQEEALPILVESGDIIVMSGESRLFYHGVPRILPAASHPWNGEVKGSSVPEWDEEYLVKAVNEKLTSDEIWDPFDSYISKTRINVNVRQVLNPGQSDLNDGGFN